MKREPPGRISSIISLGLFCLVAPAVWSALLWAALNWPVNLVWWLLLVSWSLGTVWGLLVAIGDIYAAWFMPADYKSGEATALPRQDVADRERGYPRGAEKHLKEPFTADQKPDDRLAKARSLGELGNVYAHQGDLEAAEEHYMRALVLCQEIGYRGGIGTCFTNLGLVRRDRGDVEGAEKYLRNALAAEEEIGETDALGTAFANLGLIYSDRGDLERAEEHFKKALAIFEKIDLLGVDEMRDALARLEMRRRRRQRVAEAEESESRTVAIGYRFQYEGATLDERGFLEMAGAKAVASGVITQEVLAKTIEGVPGTNQQWLALRVAKVVGVTPRARKWKKKEPPAG